MPDQMAHLKRDLVDLATSMGAVDSKVADLKMLEGPPSADPTYVMPEAQCVIAFGVPLGVGFIPEYFGKKIRMVFKEIMYEKYQLIGAIGEAMVAHLHKSGSRAVSPSPNGVYRPQSEGSRPGLMVPDFSLRYAAVASGLGS